MVLLYMGQNVLEKRWMANSSIIINFFKLDLKEWKVIKWKVNCFLLKAFDLVRWRNSYSAMARVSEYRMHLLKNFAIIMFSFHRSCLPKEINPVPPTSLSINGAYITLYGYASKGPKLEAICHEACCIAVISAWKTQGVFHLIIKFLFLEVDCVN